MKRTATSATLFDPQPAAFDARLTRFAQEVARRHRGRPADVGALIEALRAYYTMWRLFEAVPELDRAAIATAVRAYHAARPVRNRRAA